MIISERIFDLIKKKNMSQKEFSEATGIAQGSISDWKRKKTNPTSDKILIICKVLDITPEELLSGAETYSKRSNQTDYLIVDKNTELGKIVTEYHQMDEDSKSRIIEYFNALKDMQ